MAIAYLETHDIRVYYDDADLRAQEETFFST